jgi:hypothetical protein
VENVQFDALKEIAQPVRDCWMRHGALSVAANLIHTGPQTGYVAVIIQFPDWETYGKATAGMAVDGDYQRLFAEASKAGELVDRTILVELDV